MNVHHSAQQNNKPWFKHPMVWLVISIPLSSVIVGLFFVFMATNHPDDLVQDNYYKEGLAINQQFEEDQQAKDLGLSALLSTQLAANTLTVELSTTQQPFIRYNLYHPTDRDLDLSGAMSKVSNEGNGARYVIVFDTLPRGRWDLQIKGDSGEGRSQWRLRGRVVFPLVEPQQLMPADR